MPIGSQDMYQVLMLYFIVLSAREYRRTGAIQMCHYPYHYPTCSHSNWSIFIHVIVRSQTKCSFELS